MLIGVYAQNFPCGLVLLDEDVNVWDGYLLVASPSCSKDLGLSTTSVIQEFQPAAALVLAGHPSLNDSVWQKMTIFVLGFGQVFLFCCVL